MEVFPDGIEETVLDVDHEDVEISSRVADEWAAKGGVAVLSFRGYDADGESMCRVLSRDGLIRLRDAATWIINATAPKPSEPYKLSRPECGDEWCVNAFNRCTGACVAI